MQVFSARKSPFGAAAPRRHGLGTMTFKAICAGSMLLGLSRVDGRVYDDPTCKEGEVCKCGGGPRPHNYDPTTDPDCYDPTHCPLTPDYNDVCQEPRHNWVCAEHYGHDDVDCNDRRICNVAPNSPTDHSNIPPEQIYCPEPRKNGFCNQLWGTADHYGIENDPDCLDMEICNTVVQFKLTFPLSDNGWEFCVEPRSNGNCHLSFNGKTKPLSSERFPLDPDCANDPRVCNGSDDHEDCLEPKANDNCEPAYNGRLVDGVLRQFDPDCVKDPRVCDGAPEAFYLCEEPKANSDCHPSYLESDPDCVDPVVCATDPDCPSSRSFMKKNDAVVTGSAVPSLLITASASLVVSFMLRQDVLV